MNYRGLLILGVAVGAGLGATTACAGPEAGSIIFNERSSTGTTDPTGTNEETQTQGATVDGGGTNATGGGNPPFGGSAFVAGTPENAPAKGKTTHTMNAQNDPSGIDCMGCHAATFAFGGTVYSTINGAARVAGAEVRVTGPDNKLYASAFSDADGNFWIANTGAPIPAQSKVGVRNGTKQAVMSANVGGADGAKCNNATGCHGGAALRIYLE